MVGLSVRDTERNLEQQIDATGAAQLESPTAKKTKKTL